MAAGKNSPIVDAIREAERGTTGEIRVHLSRALREMDAYGRALRLFDEFGMSRTLDRNAVLLYLNLRKRRFAVVADEGIHREVGARYWEELAAHLREDLLSTHPENAIAITVKTLGATLSRYFPANLA